MRFSSALLVVAAGFAAAQTTTTTAAGTSGTSTCAAQNIVEACLGSTTPILQACKANDWQCMCDAQNAVVTCYNNCPGDPSQVAARNSAQSWCQAAAQQSSLSVQVSGTPTVRSSSSTVMATSTADSSDSAASTGSEASASSTGAAMNVHAPASGLLAVAMGVVAAL